MFCKTIALLGYTDLRKIRVNERATLWTAANAEGRKVLKIVPLGIRIEFLHREFSFNRCMGPEGTAPAPFVVPRSRFFEHEGYYILELESLDARWCHYSPPRPRDRPYDDADHERIYQALAHMRSVPRSHLPVILSGEPKLSAGSLAMTMRSWRVQAMDLYPDLDVWDELDDMIYDMLRDDLVCCLNHGDMPPKNLGRMSDGRLALIDAEFAEWRALWYDPVMAGLEMWVREGQGPAARRLITYVVDRSRRDGAFRKDDARQMVQCFQHYLTWMFHVTVKSEQENIPNLLEAFARVRTGDLDIILAP